MLEWRRPSRDVGMLNHRRDFILRRTMLTLLALALVVLLVIGALLSINGQMPLGKQTSNVTRDFLIGDGSSLEPSFLVIALYVIALVLNRRPTRWAIIGTLG